MKTFLPYIINSIPVAITYKNKPIIGLSNLFSDIRIANINPIDHNIITTISIPISFVVPVNGYIG